MTKNLSYTQLFDALNHTGSVVGWSLNDVPLCDKHTPKLVIDGFRVKVLEISDLEDCFSGSVLTNHEGVDIIYVKVDDGVWEERSTA